MDNRKYEIHLAIVKIFLLNFYIFSHFNVYQDIFTKMTFCTKFSLQKYALKGNYFIAHMRL